MLNEKVKLPKIQVLIYPWLQMFTFHLPSLIHYSDTGLVRATQVDLVDYVSWYLGITNVSEEIRLNLAVNNHTLLITDPRQRRLIESYLNVSQIPEQYRSGKNYYQQEAELFPAYELDQNSVLKDPKYFDYFKKACDPRITPLFAEHESLIGLPKTYFMITEWDALKDEGILYSERLRNAGVDVTVKFYENGFHGIALLVGELTGYELADLMVKDMNFINGK
ncbi:neutral cholesterol ester hydrolase 1 [Brachionus plicatilis]|uniref:Neutral cholesterol ester hydrolase 1 n=1 Tax=Brachionus plicatilis TaxID=10195 RepID=A0A3M7S3S9_BRAPC|nr:neutral cholesterol ester hydrolase 1 [Brachionus plicatilis]